MIAMLRRNYFQYLSEEQKFMQKKNILFNAENNDKISAYYRNQRFNDTLRNFENYINQS